MPSTIGVAWHVTRTECHSEKSRPPTTFCTTFQQPSTILLLVFVRGYTRSQQSVSRVFCHACTNRWGGGESCLFCFELFETFLFFLPFCSSYLYILRLLLSFSYWFLSVSSCLKHFHIFFPFFLPFCSSYLRILRLLLSFSYWSLSVSSCLKHFFSFFHFVHLIYVYWDFCCLFLIDFYFFNYHIDWWWIRNNVIIVNKCENLWSSN